jgi:hypothetical protein
MAVTERDLQGWFLIISGLANYHAGSDMPAQDREKLLPAINAAIQVVQSIVVDINRIADALESIAYTSNVRLEREIRR